MLSQYLHLFSKLRRDNKFGGAPHKPVLLLAVLELIRKGQIQTNRISITPELVMEFKSIWSKVVITPHTPNFALPFFHLKTEPFWKLVTVGNKTIPITTSNSIKSLNALRESVSYAEIDPELFRLMMNSVKNSVLENTLLEQYFPETRFRFNSYDQQFLDRLEAQLLNESPTIYKKRIDELKEQLSKEEYEEELYIRGGLFKREVPKIYGFQCAVSRMHIISSINAQMVDACHIVPFAVSKDDTISNGISLSPNIHRAFDRGLLTIRPDYTVKVSQAIAKNKNSPFALGQFDGKPILLPENQIHYPSPENLNWHFKECFVT